MTRVATYLTGEPITGDERPAASGGADGAEVTFDGIVRGEEESRPIVALDYEAYPEMAAAQLDAVAREAAERFGLSELTCWHRTGRVPVGEAALRVIVRARHRTPALEAVAWFVSELKRRVPIWKWGVTADGERFASSRPAR